MGLACDDDDDDDDERYILFLIASYRLKSDSHGVTVQVLKPVPMTLRRRPGLMDGQAATMRLQQLAMLGSARSPGRRIARCMRLSLTGFSALWTRRDMTTERAKHKDHYD